MLVVLRWQHFPAIPGPALVLRLEPLLFAFQNMAARQPSSAALLQANCEAQKVELGAKGTREVALYWPNRRPPSCHATWRRRWCQPLACRVHCRDDGGFCAEKEVRELRFNRRVKTQ